MAALGDGAVELPASRGGRAFGALLLALTALGCSSQDPSARSGPGANVGRATPPGQDALLGLPLSSPLDVTVERISRELPVDASTQRLRLRWSGGELTISLERNDTLVSSNYLTFELDAAGHLQRRAPAQRAPFCHYRGHLLGASGAPANAVALTTCDASGADAFSGLFFGGAALIELSAAPGRPGYQLRKVERPPFIDAAAPRSSTDDVPPAPKSPGELVLRPEAVGPTGPQGELWVESIGANDAKRLQQLGSVSAAEQSTLSIENQRAGLYFASSLSPAVRVALVAQVTFNVDPYLPTFLGNEVNTADLLGKFAQWGASALPAHDHRQLLSGFDFDGSTVGLAYVGTMCQLPTSASVIQSTLSGSLTALVAAHELGHSFGMQHDEPLGCGSSFIMAQGVCAGCQTQPHDFSACSKGSFATFLSGNVSCLTNPVTQTFNGPTCGNGIVETGEQCDCAASNCAGRDPCCNGATCKLVAQAQCSAKDACCDASTCRPLTTTAVCRPAASACDVAERCDGGTVCPVDTFQAAGVGCTDSVTSNGLCYQGHCRSRELQCASLQPSYPSLGTLVPCPSPSCGTLLCQQQSTGTCFQFSDQKFAEGTPCGSGLQCSNDSCVSSGSLNQPAAPVSVPASTTLTTALLLMLLLGAGCVYSAAPPGDARNERDTEVKPWTRNRHCRGAPDQPRSGHVR